MDWIQQLDPIVATGIAMLLSGVIGFERELRDRPAGFRTHMLVGGAAALLVGVGVLALGDHAALAASDDGGRLRTDPLRLVEAVIAGVAFIGAGSIFARRGSGVAGITTAASLLMVAVIGIACGLGYYLLASLATILTLVVLVLLGFVERLLDRRRKKGPGSQ